MTTTVYPDAERLVIAYLSPIAGVLVATRVPRPRPNRWVQVRRSGGTITKFVQDQPRIDLFAWGADEADSHDLCMTVRAAIHALAGTVMLGVACYRVEEFLGPNRADDLETGAARMWMTVQLNLRTS